MKRFLVTASVAALACSTQLLPAQDRTQDRKPVEPPAKQSTEVQIRERRNDSARPEVAPPDDRTDRNQNRRNNDVEGRAEATVETTARANQRQSRAVLGVHAAVSPTVGVHIVSLDTFGPAGTAGLLSGDYILTVDGQSVSSPRELSQTVASHRPGDTLELGIWRNGERRTVEVTLGPERGPMDRDQDRPGADEPDAWLGVLLGATDNGNGVRIEQILPDGPADKAGLRAGDILTKKDGERINSIGQFIRDIDSAEPGESVTLIVERNNETMTQQVVLGESPDFDFDFGFRGPDYPDGNEFPSDESWRDYGDEGSPTHEFLLNQHRRLAEQNERIEKMLIDIRRELREMKNDSARNGRASRSQ